LPAKFPALTRGRIVAALVVLALLTFSKNIYMAGISSYYTFYVIERFGVGVQDSQLLLFVFLAASAVGVFMGGPIGDRWGPKTVIWFRSWACCPSRWPCPTPTSPGRWR
jgi:FSR family fosmidomycin resistance protein-like MFS transporter